MQERSRKGKKGGKAVRGIVGSGVAEKVRKAMKTTHTNRERGVVEKRERKMQNRGSGKKHSTVSAADEMWGA